MEENAKNKQTERKIIELLNEMNFKHSSLGFCYWLRAISYVVNKCNKNGGFKSTVIVKTKMEDIYRYNAEYYDSTRSRVEKSMRHSLQNGKYCNIFAKQHITNKEFLILCVEKICSNK